MSRLFLVLVLVLGLAAPSPARAWSRFGHDVIVSIALKNVRPATRRAVAALFAHADLVETPRCSAATLSLAGSWADCVRNDKATGKATEPWHYQDVALCKPFDLKAACKDGNCVSAQIERNEAVLANHAAPLHDRVEALLYLIHFVGDLHQPLHASNRDNEGGNKQPASYGIYAGQKLSLHRVWDLYLAERAFTTPPALVRSYSPAERARIARGTVADWSRESWQVARDIAYASAFGGDPCGPEPERAAIDNPTIERLIPAVRRQAVRAGLRLARLLDEALG